MINRKNHKTITKKKEKMTMANYTIRCMYPRNEYEIVEQIIKIRYLSVQIAGNIARQDTESECKNMK